MQPRDPIPDADRPALTLGRPQVRLALAFAVIVAVASAVADAARYTFVVPGKYPRGTRDLLAFRTLEEAPDVLLLGSSRVDMGFDAQIVQETLAQELGRAPVVYKLAQRGMRSWLLDILLRDYVGENPPTKLLVLGVDVQLFEWLRSARPLEQAGRLRDVAAASGQLTPVQWRALMSLPFRGLQVLAASPWLLVPEVRATSAYKHAHSGEFSDATDRRLRELEQLGLFHLRLAGGEDPVGREMIHRFEGGWFDRVEVRLRGLGCRVLLVRTPVRSDFVEKVGDEVWEQYFERMRALGEEDGFEFVDLNREPYFRGDDDMQDMVHLSVASRDRVSELFAREVLAERLRE